MRAQIDPRLEVAPSIVVGAAFAGSIVVGAAFAHSVQLGIATAVAFCFVPLALLNLPLAIILWLPSVSLIAVAALDVGPNLAGMMIVAAWLGSLAARNSRIPALIVAHGPLLITAGALVLWVVLSIAWAPESPLGTDVFLGWPIALAILLVISTTLTDRRYLRLAVVAFVVGTVVSTALGLVGGATVEDEETTRIIGGAGDANFLAAGIVAAIVLSAALAAGSERLLARACAMVAVAGLTIGLIATQSRGGLVAAGVGAIAVLVLARNHRAWAVAFLLCVVGVAGAWISLDPEAWERISDFEGSTGRTELWGVGQQMWQDHPLVGVGLYGFNESATVYVRELGELEYSEFIIESPAVVHNTYLQLLAETGVVGLLLFIGVVVGCLRRAHRAATLFERSGDLAMAALSRGVIASLVAMLAAAFFISGATDRRLWFLFALGPALLACATRAGSPDDQELVPAPPRTRSRRRQPALPLPGPAPTGAGLVSEAGRPG